MLERAWAAGIDRIIITATNAAEAAETLALARTDGLYPALVEDLCRLLCKDTCFRAEFGRGPHSWLDYRHPGGLFCRVADRLFCTVGVHPTRCDEFELHPAGPDGYMAQLTRILEDGQSDGKARISRTRLLGDLTCRAACQPEDCWPVKQTERSFHARCMVRSQRHVQVVAVGEFGLDYDRSPTDVPSCQLARRLG